MNDSASTPTSPVRRVLPSPDALRSRHPLGSAGQRTVEIARARIIGRLRDGEGPALAIVGPCSIHDRTAALDYAERLRALQHELGESVLLVMRAYFEKPRTSLGWKGFLYDPRLDGSDDLEAGLSEARSLLVELAELGVPTATELLDPLIAPYLADTLSWAAVGARTTESQIHRQLASNMPLAVGFKNGTDGSLDAALNAVIAANAAHSMLGIDDEGRLALLSSRGNPAAHVVLRGGRSGPNYDAASVQAAASAMRKAGLNQGVVVDCSHGNSDKAPERQPHVARVVIEQLARRVEGLAGLMLESHLVAGAQSVHSRPLAYGQSVTDGCIDFASTAEVLRELREALTGAAERRSFVGRTSSAAREKATDEPSMAGALASPFGA